MLGLVLEFLGNEGSSSGRAGRIEMVDRRPDRPRHVGLGVGHHQRDGIGHTSQLGPLRMPVRYLVLSAQRVRIDVHITRPIDLTGLLSLNWWWE